MTKQEFVNAVSNNDAAIQVVSVVLTLRDWGKTTISAGRATRRWFDTDETIAPLLILFAQVVFLAAALAAKYMAVGAIAFVRWVRERGVRETLTVADAACRFLLCYEDGGDAGEQPVVVEAEPETGLTEELIDWAIQRWPQLAA